MIAKRYTYRDVLGLAGPKYLPGSQKVLIRILPPTIVNVANRHFCLRRGGGPKGLVVVSIIGDCEFRHTFSALKMYLNILLVVLSRMACMILYDMPEVLSRIA
jgi:hypothetical protein